MSGAKAAEKRGNFLILGASGTGKTCMIKRFINRSFTESLTPSTIGCDTQNVEFKIGGTELKLVLIDTAGQEIRYDTITKTYLRLSDAFILVYDVGRRESFETIKNKYLKRIREECPENKKVMLVGNKCDLSNNKRVVSYDEGRAFASKNGINLFLECSAKDGFNVDTVFHCLGQNLIGFGHVQKKDVQEKAGAKKSIFKKLKFWSKKSKETQEIVFVTVVNNHPDRNVLFIVVPPKEKDSHEEIKKISGVMNATATGGGVGGTLETQAKFIRNDVAHKFKNIQPHVEWEYTSNHGSFDFLILFPKGKDFPHRYFYAERNSATPATHRIDIEEATYFDGLPEMEVKFLPNGTIDITNA